jgi:hypothetical protein
VSPWQEAVEKRYEKKRMQTESLGQAFSSHPLMVQ